MLDEDYKLTSRESQKEVRTRMLETLKDILKPTKIKNYVLVKIKMDKNFKKIYYKNTKSILLIINNYKNFFFEN